MSSSIVRRAVLEDAPLVIDNAFEIEEVAEPSLADNLFETLQQEHPDADPGFIETAVQDAIEQLSQPEETAEFGIGNLEFGEDVVEAEPLSEFERPAVTEALVTPPPAPVVDTSEILAEAQQQAAQIVESAKAEAARVLAEADTRAAEIEGSGYQKGYDEGVTAGTLAGEQQAVEMIKQVAAIVNEASALHDTMLHEAEAEMVALCLEIARKIIQAELRTNPDVVKSVLAAAVQKINGSPRVTIKVNPAQVESVNKHWLTAYGSNYREKEWAIEGDAAVTPGGCVLDTKYGSIDAQIGTQFGEIQKTFALLLGTGS